MQISATIVTLNEERNIARAIESLRMVDEIVVVDSGSSDRTRDIAAKLGARVVEEKWRGYAGQKNYAAECASHDWILSIDADECVTEDLEGEILQLRKDGPKFRAYSFPRLAQYLGRWIRHGGWYPDRKIRLYDRNAARWEGAYVHESVHTTETVGELQGNLLHFTCASLSEHLKTIDRYTRLAADELRASGKAVSLRHLIVDPIWAVFRTYIIRRGFLDGVPGVSIAWMAGLYVFLKYARAVLPEPNA
ncbi:MAG: glycosyltransferase family 2 protein [Acidobacteriota bacterium]|nr:glycosyltransferase family 2 protein [Acidobacteriota bacterium]